MAFITRKILNILENHPRKEVQLFKETFNIGKEISDKRSLLLIIEVKGKLL